MEEDKERDLEILKNYQKKEAQGIKKIFIINDESYNLKICLLSSFSFFISFCLM